jgi:putative FmdB family regulatory protein
MPSYDYECKKCGVFEVQQSIKDPPLTECPKCKKKGKKSSPPKRLISLSSFQLKGGGWSSEGYK